MKHYFLKVFALFLCLNVGSFAGTGIFQTYIIINNNGAGNVYRAGGANADAGTIFQGTTWGTHTSSTTLVISGGELKSYKNSGGNVTGAKMFYRIYKQGSLAPSFTELNLPWVEDLGGGDQKWTTTSANINVLQNVNSTGTWIIEVYWQITSNEGDSFDSNSGSNFTATFIADASLPVELTSFTSMINNANVQLNWQTATEVNNYGFDVERAIGSRQEAVGNWEKIAFVQGHGNSNSPKNYSFTDTPTGSDKFQYRLKQTDFDGKFEYSNIIDVELESPANFSVQQNYPNPFNPATTIRYELPQNSFVTVKIFDSLGRELKSLMNANQESGLHQVNFNASDYPSGIYYYTIDAGVFSQTKKMLLIK